MSCVVIRVLFLSLLTDTPCWPCSAPSRHSPVPAAGAYAWDPLLDTLVANLGGRTLHNIPPIVAIIGAGIGFYFANEGTWIRSAFGLVIGFSIAAAAATWVPAFFGIARRRRPPRR